MQIFKKKKKKKKNIPNPFLSNHSSPLLLISKKRQNTDPLTGHGVSLWMIWVMRGENTLKLPLKFMWQVLVTVAHHRHECWEQVQTFKGRTHLQPWPLYAKLLVMRFNKITGYWLWFWGYFCDHAQHCNVNLLVCYHFGQFHDTSRVIECLTIQYCRQSLFLVDASYWFCGPTFPLII